MITSHFLGSRTSLRVAVATEDKYHNNECPPLLLLALGFVAEQTSEGTEQLFGQFGSAHLAVTPPEILPTLSRLVRVVGDAPPRCCGALLSGGGVVSTFLAVDTQHSPVRAAAGKTDSIPARPDAGLNRMTDASRVGLQTNKAAELPFNITETHNGTVQILVVL